MADGQVTRGTDGEGPLPPLTDLEYRVLKEVLAESEAREAKYRAETGRRGFEDADADALRDIDDFMATMRAAVEGYEATHRG